MTPERERLIAHLQETMEEFGREPDSPPTLMIEDLRSDSEQLAGLTERLAQAEASIRRLETQLAAANVWIARLAAFSGVEY